MDHAVVKYLMGKFVLIRDVGKGISGVISDYLAGETGLSKMKIKDAMNKGALWIGKKKGGLRRLRRAKAEIHAGDHIEFHYDEKLLSLKPSQARLMEDCRDYSVWFKPAGLMAQGTMFGDHCSLMRQAELSFGNERQIFLVHRLDREAAGLVLIAHTKRAAALLSEIFRNNLIEKKYRVEVLGYLADGEGVIDLPLDGKDALTEYLVLSYDSSANASLVDVKIKTGRLHQIRRHFEMIGHPVMGDPKYGKENKNAEGMKLTAYSLKFRCPLRNGTVEFSI